MEGCSKTLDYMGKSEFETEARAALEDDIDRCPICAVPFQADDVCADDITEGTCHAGCLEGSAVVDLETGDEIPGGKIDTYLYSEVMAPRIFDESGKGAGFELTPEAVVAAMTIPSPQTHVDGAELLATVKEFARWHHLNELTIYTGGKPSDSEIDFEATAWNTIKRALAATEGQP